MSVRLPLLPTHAFSQPSIDTDGEYCSDGVGRESLIEIFCPKCGQLLFSSKDLNWMEGGYWASPALTLQKPYYNGTDKLITCPRKSCKKVMKLYFFSYMG